jgi:superfamily I DNA/RNA helicase
MSWWRSAGDLSQPQLDVVNNAVERISSTSSGACTWVQGCAGTGKTLILAHIAQRLQASDKNCSIIFLTYTHALKAMIHKTVSQSGVNAAVSTYLSFLHSRQALNYDVIVLDEIQDVKLVDLAALKKRCIHLVVAGDCEQRIYEQANTESAIDGVIAFEKSRLIELFRITRFIVKVAQKIMPWTMLAEGDTSNIKRDVSIAVKQFNDDFREAKWVYTEAMAFARPTYPSAILLPHHNAILEFCRSLAQSLGIIDSGPAIRIESNRISDYNLGNGIGDINESDGRPFVFIMTYHNSNGLDFDNVLLPLLHAKQDIISHQMQLKMADAARVLFFVAITRTRERLILTYTGDAPHPYLGDMPKDVVSFTRDDPTRDVDEEEDLF